MSCKYNNCKVCGYKSECEIYKENAELKGEADSVLDNWCKGDDPCPHLKKRDEQLTKAKELLKEYYSLTYGETMTEEQILNWLDKNNRGFTQKDFELFKKFHEESTKELEIHIEELKKQLDLKEKALSKAKKETKRIADRVNKDKRRLIRRKAELEAQIEKMKCCQNCSHLCSRCELGIDGCYVCSKWELRR